MYPVYMYEPFSDARHCRGVILKTSSQKMRVARDTVYECCMAFALCKCVNMLYPRCYLRVRHLELCI